ncbi:coiled-coil domain-containing protein 6-like isoform X1 [Vanessa atalanta]|uniref:coiled-coil domain-containing protein 6-like isoform X1 n=1 Tax=Vanessa atalanta TaxID=42275 RepID=UPI001FCD7861|nr:coiled-coil domain-containing protein 6-like isoform X1 [Vanessa atalanta]
MDDSMISPDTFLGNKMGDSASESDSSSLDGGAMLPPSTVSRDQLQKRIESLQQQNRVLKVELDTYKLRVKALQEENRALRQASVSIQAKAEQEEEYISNTLLKKIQALKKEKETLAHHYEREEECLTNDLSRKLNQLRQEKCRLEQTLEQEQECLVNKLMRKIEKLEAETLAKQTNLERLRREKVELENTLEQEQEALVNRLWKRMDKLEAEKRSLQIRLDQPVSDPASPRDISNGDTASNLSNHIQTLRSEVVKLRNQLAVSQNENKEKMQRFVLEEKHIREENIRLHRKLQQEVERREALCRHLSESESSLEMEEERQFNEALSARSRSVSSPGGSRPLSPYASPLLPAPGLPLSRPAMHFNSQARRASERFVKPAVPGGALLPPRAPLEPPAAPAPAPPAPPAPPSPSMQPASPMDTSSRD